MKKKPSDSPPQPASDLQGKIREAEFKNILQKLKDGKTLTARESKIAAEFAAKRDGKGLTQAELAAAWGMTQPNIHKMVKQGMPMTSIEAATEWRKDWLETHGRGDTAPENIQQAKLRKTLLECEKIEFSNAVDRGEYVKKSEQREAGIKIGAAISSRMGAFVMDASSACAGLDQKENYRQLSARGEIMLKAFREDMEKV
jgi:predicted XRE-type DNA-binding protein